MNAVLLPVVHPSFEKLKLSGRWLHFSAAIFILSHALSHLRHQESSQLYIWCQFIISVDILALFFAGQRFISQMPGVSLFFRMVEVIFFTGIGIIMLLSANWLTGVVHIFLGIAYCFLFYCERKLRNEELVFIHHTGITMPALPDNKFLLWSNINEIETNYDSIRIVPSAGKPVNFELRKNLSFEQLDQIHEFCRHYLGQEF